MASEAARAGVVRTGPLPGNGGDERRRGAGPRGARPGIVIYARPAGRNPLAEAGIDVDRPEEVQEMGGLAGACGPDVGEKGTQRPNY
jgi:hypothetical protein